MRLGFPQGPDEEKTVHGQHRIIFLNVRTNFQGAGYKYSCRDLERPYCHVVHVVVLLEERSDAEIE